MSAGELHDAWIELARSVRLAKLTRSAEVDAAMLHIVDTAEKRGRSRLVKLPPITDGEVTGKCRVR